MDNETAAEVIAMPKVGVLTDPHIDATSGSEFPKTSLNSAMAAAALSESRPSSPAVLDGKRVLHSTWPEEDKASSVDEKMSAVKHPNSQGLPALLVPADSSKLQESLKMTVLIMKEREFTRFYLGAVGDKTILQAVCWFGISIAVVALYLMAFCYRFSTLSLEIGNYLNFSTLNGTARMLALISIPITLICITQFGETRSYYLSVLVSKLFLFTFIIFATVSLFTKLGEIACKTSSQSASLSYDAGLLLLTTLPHCIIFLASTLNILLSPAIFNFWLSHVYKRSFKTYKEQTIDLQLPLPESYSSTYHGKFRKNEFGILEFTPAHPKVKLGKGKYHEIKSESLSYFFLRASLNFLLPRRYKLLPKYRAAAYVGEVDGDGLPHGFGHWRSDTYHGETLVGYWNQGVPVAPFKSREYGTGSGFMSIRIGWVKATTSSDEIEYGMADAECCVSGTFFRSFPRVVLYPLSGERHGFGAFIRNRIPKKRAECRTLQTKGITMLSLDTLESEDETRVMNEHPVKNEDSIEAGRFSKMAPCQTPSSKIETASERSLVNEISFAKDNTAEGAKQFLSPTLRNNSKVKFSSFSVRSLRDIKVAHRAKNLFARHKRRVEAKESKSQREQTLMATVLTNMMPHLPNFGLSRSTELQIAVDSEKGLYIAGWVPLAAMGDQPQLVRKHVRVSGPPVPKASTDLLETNKFIRDAEDAPSSPNRQFLSAPTARVVPSLTIAESSHHDVNTGQPASTGLKIVVISKQKEGRAADGETATERDEIASNYANSEEAEALQNFQDCPVDPLAPGKDPQRLFSGIATMPHLHVEGWVPSEAAGTPEAWIFCHGYNTTLLQMHLLGWLGVASVNIAFVLFTLSLQILGQMASFGNFPNYIKPIIFTWPAGTNFLQFFTALDNACNPNIHNAFKSLLVSLKNNGIYQLHIMGHSMGARLLIMSLRKIIEDIQLFAPLKLENSGEKMNNNALELVTFTLLNPEYGLEEFVEKEYVFLRKYCANISIFCDSRDGIRTLRNTDANITEGQLALCEAAATMLAGYRALKWAERFSRKKELGRSVFDLRRIRMVATAYYEASPFIGSGLFRFAGREPSFLKSIEKSWLDVDVIDMTWLDSNVHALRHSYWPLNREIIEDIRELIVTRKRARQRSSRLDRREGNVWVYRVAPSNITSIFERDF